MKLYFAIIDDFDNVITSVSTGTPMDLLKQVFISCPTGEFDLSRLQIAERIEEIDHIFATIFAGIDDPVVLLDRLSLFLTGVDRREDMAEQLADELLIYNLVNDGPDLVDFLMNLRMIFAGTEYDLSAMSEDQTTLIVRIEM